MTVAAAASNLDIGNRAHLNASPDSVMAIISKLSVHPGTHLWSVACSVAVAAVTLAVNSSRKRRREGGPDEHVRWVPGGRGRRRDGRKRPMPRYEGASGKTAWTMRPERTQWWLDYVEHEELAADPTSILGKEFRQRMQPPP